MGFKIVKASTQFEYGMSSPEQLEGWLRENPQIIGFSFIGRSNVGKSSTINTLFGAKTARTSKTPGRTREINIFTFDIESDGEDKETVGPFYFFDLPGYGHAEVAKKISENWRILLSTFFENVSSNVLMLNLQDARHPHQKSDQKFQEYLKDFKFETILAFNKLDKLKTQKERSVLEKLKPSLFKEYKWVKQIHFISAEKKKGFDALNESLITYILRKNEFVDFQEDEEL